MADGRARGRIPVQQRAWRTRVLLLDAAAECLAEHGYAATTLARVQERSGVSRGSLLHQFPSRQALLSAALRHCVARWRGELAERKAARAVGIDGAIDRLWYQYQTSALGALAEMLSAARTDAILEQSLREHHPGIVEFTREPFRMMTGPEFAEHPLLSDVWTVLIGSMGSLLTAFGAGRDPKLDEFHVAMWKRIAHAALDPPITGFSPPIDVRNEHGRANADP